MASAFGHIAVAYAMGKTLDPAWYSPRFWVLTALCSVLPDADVVGFVLGVPYEHMLGHRGITHSIFFATFVGILVPRMAVPALSWRNRRYGILALFFGLVTLSHGLLDALTNGGLGIAFLAPFDGTRYFFPWRPIAVSPIGVLEFFSSLGLGVIFSELVWIGIPVTVWLLGYRVLNKKG